MRQAEVKVLYSGHIPSKYLVQDSNYVFPDSRVLSTTAPNYLGLRSDADKGYPDSEYIVDKILFRCGLA